MVAAECDQGRGQHGSRRGGERADPQRAGQVAAGGGEGGLQAALKLADATASSDVSRPGLPGGYMSR
jgi:hypothetical protein